MTQGSLDKAKESERRDERAELDTKLCEKAHRDSRRMLEDAIPAIGGMDVAAGACKVDRSDLRKALDLNGRRGVLLVDYLYIGRKVMHENRSLITRLASAIVNAWDLDVFPRVSLTDKERADRLEAQLRAMPLGDQLVEHALGSRR